jgi:hypothetical protein
MIGAADHRLGHQLEQVQVVHGGEHVRAVGALLAPRLDQAACLEALEHAVQKQVLRPARDEARAELGKHAEVEAGIGQLEPERVFPIDASTHCVGRLPVAEMLEELEHRDERQPPRCQAGLAPSGVSSGTSCSARQLR